MNRPRPLRRALLLGLLLGALAPTAGLADEAALRAQAEKLATLRGEVESLADELSLAKDTARSDLRALQAEEADLRARVRREEQRLLELRLETERIQEDARQAEQSADALIPVLEQAMTATEERIRGGLPFRVQERLDEVGSLRKQLQQSLLPPATVASRLWQLQEDELRLTKENGLYKQIIPLGDSEVLAEVARLGMVTLYFRTDAGAVGKAVRAGAGWRFEAFSDPAQQQTTHELFVALKKQIRTGFFELARPFPEQG